MSHGHVDKVYHVHASRSGQKGQSQDQGVSIEVEVLDNCH